MLPQMSSLITIIKNRIEKDVLVLVSIIINMRYASNIFNSSLNIHSSVNISLVSQSSKANLHHQFMLN